MKLSAAAIFATSFVGLSASVPIERHALPPIESTAGVAPVIPSIDVARPVLKHVQIAGRQLIHEAPNSLGPITPIGGGNPGAHVPSDAFSAFNSPGPVIPADMPEPVPEKQGEHHRAAQEREELEKRHPGPDVTHKLVSIDGDAPEHGADLEGALSSGPVKPMTDRPLGKENMLDEGTSEELERQREKAAKNRMIDWAGGQY
ncbi:hypothetical protein NpNSSI1_00009924 [Neofusicoccum parvum]|nr:hypothetical protein NpNSSI1_00009924 [Neofusicoccum parvum]